MEDPLDKHDNGRASYIGQSRFIVFAALAAVAFLGVLVIAFITSLVGKSGGEQFPKLYFQLIASILGALVNQPFRDAETNTNQEPSLFVLYAA